MIKKGLIIMTSVVALAIVACNSDSSKGETTKTDSEKKETGSSPSSSPDYAPGLAVIQGSDCLTCHRIDEKIQGPTYKEVANRYADSAKAEVIPRIAQKIIEGGSGVWGEVPMTPHPGLTQEDAEKAVKYVLLFKD